MRLKIFAAALAIAISAPALAQDWVEYPYADMGFAVQFPEAPKVETISFRTPSGSMAPATVYSVQQGKIIFKITVADYAMLPNDQANAIAQAVKAVGDTGTVLVDVNSRVGGAYGHELSVTDKDGGRSTMAIFFEGQKLYELEAKVLPPNPLSGTGDAIRFQQSLRFIGTAAGRGFRPGGGRPGFRRPGFGPRNPPPGDANPSPLNPPPNPQ